MKNGWKACLLGLLAMLFLTGCGKTLPESAETSSESPPMPPISSASALEPQVQPSEAYLELIAKKEELIAVVQNRIEAYRASGGAALMEHHHPPYPEDFPSMDLLKDVTDTSQFAVRQEGNLESLGSIYLAVRIDDSHEMRITASQHQNSDNTLSWGSGDTWWVVLEQPGAGKWDFSDLDLY